MAKFVQVDIADPGLTTPNGSAGLPWICRDTNGVLHCTYMKWFDTEPTWRIMHGYSSDDGDTWTLEEAVTDGGYDPGICIDSSNNIYIIYEYSESSTVRRLRCAYWDGASWSTEEITSWNPYAGSAAAYARVLVDGSNNIHVVFKERLAIATYEHHHMIRASGVWGSDTTIFSGAAGNRMLTIDDWSYLHFIYTISSGGINYFYHRTYDGSWSDAEEVTSSASSISINDFVVDASNNLHLVYHFYSAPDMTYYYQEKLSGEPLWESAEQIQVVSASPYPTLLLSLSKDQEVSIIDIKELGTWPNSYGSTRMWQRNGSWAASSWQNLTTGVEISWVDGSMHHLFPYDSGAYPGLTDTDETIQLIETYNQSINDSAIHFLQFIGSWVSGIFVQTAIIG